MSMLNAEGEGADGFQLTAFPSYLARSRRKAIL
jgi:hypothetical protein